jgi:chromosome partitioning protein
MKPIPTIAFFNNKGGVGKTSLVYHMSWMLSELKHTCLAVDLDPQSNLTSLMLDEDKLEELWEDGKSEPCTIYHAVYPQLQGTGDVAMVKETRISDKLYLLPGDLRLSAFEDLLSSEWPKAMDGQPSAFRVLTSFSRCMQHCAMNCGASYILVDVGPNLGALNRAALIACDYVVVPLAPDLFSLQGLKNLGPTLRSWQKEWSKRRKNKPSYLNIVLPRGDMKPIGYIVQQHQVRLDRPVQAYQKWLARIPTVYAESVLDTSAHNVVVENDDNCIGMLKHYASLVPLAQEARKPIFKLQAADGALGGHAESARKAGDTYRKLALGIIDRCSTSRSPASTR